MDSVIFCFVMMVAFPGFLHGGQPDGKGSAEPDVKYTSGWHEKVVLASSPGGGGGGGGKRGDVDTVAGMPTAATTVVPGGVAGGANNVSNVTSPETGKLLQAGLAAVPHASESCAHDATHCVLEGTNKKLLFGGEASKTTATAGSNDTATNKTAAGARGGVISFFKRYFKW